MGLSKIKLGELIEQCNDRNTELLYSIDSVRGISTDKKFIETKANLDGVNLISYKIVKPNTFAYVADTSRRGNKIALAFNNTKHNFLISSIYTVFKMNKAELLPYFLFIYFNRPEFDRYARFNSWGSARETFDWADFCDIELELPPLDIQKKYVAIYSSMLANQQNYERGLEDLKLTCNAIMDEYKHTSQKVTAGKIFKEIDYRNTDLKITEVQGINITKQFMPSIANTQGVDLSKYKLVQKKQFAFSGMQTGRDKCIRIALHTKDTPIIISPAYTVLEITDSNILPEYIMIWFSRKEIDRLGWFMSDASIRTNLDLERFYEIKIPIPDLKTQQSIVNIYNAYMERKKINEQLKEQIRSICPILIKGSLEEARNRKDA